VPNSGEKRRVTCRSWPQVSRSPTVSLAGRAARVLPSKPRGAKPLKGRALTADDSGQRRSPRESRVVAVPRSRGKLASLPKSSHHRGGGSLHPALSLLFSPNPPRARACGLTRAVTVKRPRRMRQRPRGPQRTDDPLLRPPEVDARPPPCGRPSGSATGPRSDVGKRKVIVGSPSSSDRLRPTRLAPRSRRRRTCAVARFAQERRELACVESGELR
jgi:hypothetical protein